MCGIIGVLNRRGNLASVPIEDMARSIVHRGPDDSGMWHSKNIWLGFRRLSILDLSLAGHQPMVSADGQYILVFNGEIYNYQQLREKYCAGVELRSTSDTEILLHLLAQKGSTIIPELRGMFAFALWDREAEELLIGRDAFGKKPLYYVDTPDIFLFASEPKALLASSLIEKKVDEATLAAYFQHEYVVVPATGWKGIKQLAMGQCMRVTKEKTEITQWWKPVFHPKHTTLSEEKALEALDTLLNQAVERRMVADVPVGVFLSGGLDSTTITWYMKQHKPQSLHSFAVSFTEPSFNESAFSESAASSLGTTHHDILFTLDTFKQALTEIMPRMDIPLADASLLPTYVLSKEAKKHITVALDGDGSDELFAGYGTFAAAEIAEWFNWLPRSVFSDIAMVAQALPTRHTYFSLDFKIKSFLRGMGYPRLQRNQVWLGAFTSAELKKLLTPSYQQSIKSVFSGVNALEDTKLSTLDAVSLGTIQGYLQNDILVKLDRATMFTSVEARTPFLDIDLAEFVMKLPEKLKRNKYLLKKLMHGRIPQDIITRPKKGFGIPIGKWLQHELYTWAENVLKPEKLRQDGILAPEYVQELLKKHKRGTQDYRKHVWTLISFQLWYDYWVKGDKSTHTLNH